MTTSIKKHRDKKTLLRIITNSESEAFACERLWWFKYVEGLSAFATPAPLRQGSLVGRGIEAWAESGSTMTVGQIEDTVLAPWQEQRAELHRDGRVEDEDRDDDEKILEQSRAMLAGYVKHWADDAETWETIATEAQVARWIDHPVVSRAVTDRPARAGVSFTAFANGAPLRRHRRWAYGGKLDRLVRHRGTGAIWLMETKTTKDSNLDAYVRKLHFDPQVRGYAWALARPAMSLTDRRLVDFALGQDGDASGIRVEGVIYDVARKAVPTAPTPIKSGKRLPVASQVSCDRATYVAAALAHGLDPDDEFHAAQAEALAGVRFFQREAYPFTDAEVEDFGVGAGWRALAMIEAERRPYHPRQTRVCAGIVRGCPGGFESICMADGPMARRSFTKMTIRHPELTGELAEPWVGTERNTAPAAPVVEADPFVEDAVDSVGDSAHDATHAAAAAEGPVADDFFPDQDQADPFGPSADGEAN